MKGPGREGRRDMHRTREKKGNLHLEDLPLLPGQAESLEKAGLERAADLLKHPAVQEGIGKILAQPREGWDREVLDLPLETFLSGPGLKVLESKGCRTLEDLLSMPAEDYPELNVLEWNPQALLEALGLPRGERDALDRPIEEFAHTPRARKACRLLGVRTLRDFLALDRSEFLSVPGVGPKTWKGIEKGVREYLSRHEETPRGGYPGLDTPLSRLVENKRALKAFRELGLETVKDFLRTPRDRFLSLRNFGERTWWEIQARIQALFGAAHPVPPACPPSLLELRVELLPLPGRALTALKELEVRTVGDLFSLPKGYLLAHRNFGEESWKALVAALDETVRNGIAQVAGPSPDDVSGLEELKRLLDERLPDDRSRFVLETRTGLEGGKVLTLQRLASRLGISRERARQISNRVRETLLLKARPYLERLRREALERLASLGGIAAGSEMAALPLARGGRGPRARARAVEGLLLFFFPESFHRLSTKAFTTAAPETVRRIQKVLESLFAKESRARPKEDLEKALREAGLDPGETMGLALHLAKFRFGVSLVRGRKRETLQAPRVFAAERVAAILSERKGPTTLSDLQVLFSSRYSSISRRRLLRILSSDKRFVRTGPESFGLARAFPLDPEKSRAWREEARRKLEVERRPMAAGELVPGEDPYLVARALRGAKGIRSLGGLLFSHDEAGRKRPSWVEERVRSLLEETGGPLPREDLVRALSQGNGPSPALLEEVLLSSRAFCLYPEGGYGLSDSHPVPPEERSRALDGAAGILAERGGYDRMGRLLSELRNRSLLHPDLDRASLQDLMIRDGRFEFFGREFVCSSGAGTVPWIQETALSALRAAGTPLSLPRLVAERPELAEFEEALEEILRASPFVVALEDGKFGLLS